MMADICKAFYHEIEKYILHILKMSRYLLALCSFVTVDVLVASKHKEMLVNYEWPLTLCL
jgi:hypothetical protein